jgi:hypothetical protein
MRHHGATCLAECALWRRATFHFDLLHRNRRPLDRVSRASAVKGPVTGHRGLVGLRKAVSRVSKTRKTQAM